MASEWRGELDINQFDDGTGCAHTFAGWRAFEDGCGGETFCAKCNMGAMERSIRVDDLS